MNKIKVMIVDDHPLIIAGITSLLSEAKNIDIVCEANSGKQAIELLKTINIDVILMDIDMPNMNGCDATKVIVKKFPNIKIITLTMFNEKTLISEMMSAGAKGYVLKNTEQSELIEAIEKVCEGQIYYSSEISFTLIKPGVKNILSIAQPEEQLLHLLSERELQILKYIAKGLTNPEISRQLFISCRTVDTHRYNLMRKLDIHNVAGLIKYAIKTNLI